MKRNFSFFLKIGNIAKAFALLVAMIPFVACNEDKEACEKALLDWVNESNTELPETITKGVQYQCTLDKDNLVYLLYVDEKIISTSSVVNKVRTNRNQFLNALWVENTLLTQEDRQEINKKYGIKGSFQTTRDFMLHLLRKTGRGVSIQIQGSKHRDRIVAATYTVDEL